MPPTSIPLKRFRDSFTAKSPPGGFDNAGPKAHLKFPKLGKPATFEDVASARAIFSLAGADPLGRMAGGLQSRRILVRSGIDRINHVAGPARSGWHLQSMD
jgi:hypothetical protein